MICPDFNMFKKFILSFDQKVQIDKDKDKKLRFNVWATTQQSLKDMINTLDVNALPESVADKAMRKKLTNAAKRIENSSVSPKKHKIIKALFGEESKYPIEMAIALHEVIESVKGEADKARNNFVNISEISADGTLPALPRSRTAASIGRKIAYQKGYRFKRAQSDQDAAVIEALYYDIGNEALSQLESAGLVDLTTRTPTIMDYINKEDLNKTRRKVEILNKTALSVSLNSSALGIKRDSEEANYFLDRAVANLQDTEFGVTVDALKMARLVTQPSTIELPDTSPDKSDLDLAMWDDGINKPDETTAKARKDMYKKPVYVHDAIHDLLVMLNEESAKTGATATEIARDVFGMNKQMLNRLFGLKESDNFSVDKKQSIAGQNLSKSTPFDDVVEYYDQLTNNGKPSPLHMAMKIGRNARLYFLNSVLNPHASKMSRYMLTAGSYSVDVDSDNYKYLVYQIAKNLDKRLRYDDIVNPEKLTGILNAFEQYKKAKSSKAKLKALAPLARKFDKDFVTIITSLQAIQDIRNPIGGKIETQYTISSDATASGGTLTFMQALGSNPKVSEFMQRIGLMQLDDGSLVKQDLDDLYGLMSESIEDYISDNPKGMGPDIGMEDTVDLLKKTLDMLFNKGDDVRELSKDPTMTFIYGQGLKSATDTMANNLANRIVDSLGKAETQEFLKVLLGEDNDFVKAPADQQRKMRGLHMEIVDSLKTQEIPQTLYNIMKSSVKAEFLDEYMTRSVQVWEFVQKLDKKKVFKVLPAGAVLDGKTAAKDLKTYGMPLTKEIWVSNSIEGRDDTVLTRKERPQATVMNVSTTHSIDAALMYHSIAALNPEGNITSVHDDARGMLQDVRGMEKQYVTTAIDVLTKYDVHQQVMEAIAVQDPELANTPEFKTLKAQIDAEMKTKQELASKLKEDTDALIGDGNKYLAFAEGSNPTTPEPTKVKSKPKAETAVTEEVKVETQPKAEDLTEQFLTKENQNEVMEKLREGSPLIERFLNDKNASLVVEALKNSYKPKEDTVTLSGTNEGLAKKPRKLDMNKPADVKTMQTILEHEITHANTMAYLQFHMNLGVESAELRDIIYMSKAIAQLAEIDHKAGNRPITGMSMEARSRVQYILSQPSQVNMVAEFVAVMGAEDAVAAEILRLIGSQQRNTEYGIKGAIQRFIDRVKVWMDEITDKDIDGPDMDMDKLAGAIVRTMDQGVEFREQKYDFARAVMQGQDDVGLGPKPEPRAYARKASIDYANYVVSSMLNDPLERNSKRILGNIHKILDTHIPLYSSVAKKAVGIYDGSPALQQFVHTVTGEGVDKTKKADILAQMAAISSQQKETTNDQIAKLRLLSKDLTKEQLFDLDVLTSQVNLHDYFALASKFNTAKKIEKETKRLRDELWKENNQAVRRVEQLVQKNVNEDFSGEVYNLATIIKLAGDPKKDGWNVAIRLRKYLALRSIQEVGSKKFETLLENKELMRVVKDNVLANRMATIDNAGTESIRDSMVSDYYKEPIEIRAVSEDNFKMYEYGENTGWKVTEAPGPGKMGIVYRETIDASDIAGAFTDIKLADSDLNVDEKFRRHTNVMKTIDGYKLVLTREQKRKMGLIEDFSQGLVRSAAHSMAIQDSQIIRNELLKKETRFVIGTTGSKEELETLIKAENKDNPWFVKLPDNMTYNDLPALVKAKYMPVGSRASNVKEFHNNVDLVRKDISHWLLGAKSSSLFQNPQMKWAMRILKNAVSGAKIGMVVLNPVKIANDNLSNITYLGVMGVDPLFITKNYAEISADFGEYSDLTRQIFQLKVKMVARPESTKLKKELKLLQKRLKANRIGDIGEKGFVNSLGSDLVSRSADTLSGFQSDMHKALEYLLINDKGNKNYLGHFVKELSKIGPDMENFFQYLGGIVGQTGKSAKVIEQELDQVANRLREIKTEDDIVNYVAQFTTSPSSEAVRMGSAVTDLTDVLAKETLYRHYVQNIGMTDEQARIKVLDSFPDYKENLPLSVKQLSDVGIIMFPSFWLRIQKAIYRMMRDKPINLASELMIQDMLGTDVNTIFEANIINKSNTFGGLIHSPFEPVGIGSVVPVHLW